MQSPAKKRGVSAGASTTARRLSPFLLKRYEPLDAQEQATSSELEIRLASVPAGTTRKGLASVFAKLDVVRIALDPRRLGAVVTFASARGAAKGRRHWQQISTEGRKRSRAHSAHSEPEKESRQRAAREIASLASRRQLERAASVFEEFLASGARPSVQLFASMVNAHVNSGDVEGAHRAFSRMLRCGLEPNVVVYTALLKGHCRSGDLAGASRVLEEMTARTPAILPDLHTVNTFLRGCARVGDVEAAMALHARLADWRLALDGAGRAFLVRLLCHARRLREARELAEAPALASRSLCQFWAGGRCRRGSRCLFAHDPLRGPRRAEELCSAAAVRVDLAEAMALQGLDPSRELAAAEELCAAEVEEAHQQAQLGRLRAEVARLRAEPGPPLALALARLFVFGEEATAQSFLERLGRFGLQRVPAKLQRRFERSIAGGLLRWRWIFGRRRRGLPVKLEICSGAGDWVAAQARADRANWVALEIMHERVHGIFSRMALARLRNLCVLGGDASKVLRHVPPASVAQVCINFPEPPHVSGDENAQSELHLLTPTFFEQVHGTLSSRGGLTILSDNCRYMRTLALSIADLNRKVPIFESVQDGIASELETLGGITILRGTPGPSHGHLSQVASQFDELWARHRRTDRIFLALRRI